MLGAECFLPSLSGLIATANVPGGTGRPCAITELLARGLDVIAAGRLTQADAREVGVLSLERVVEGPDGAAAELVGVRRQARARAAVPAADSPPAVTPDVRLRALQLQVTGQRGPIPAVGIRPEQHLERQ